MSLTVLQTFPVKISLIFYLNTSLLISHKTYFNNLISLNVYYNYNNYNKNKIKILKITRELHGI